MKAAHWWLVIKRSRANLALLIAGCLLVVMAPVWRLAVAPALRVVAGDFDQLYYYQGELTTYPAVAGQPRTSSIAVQQGLFSRTDLCTPDISAVQEEWHLYESETGKVLSEGVRIYTINRRTGELAAPGDADRERSGYYVVFPFDCPGEDVPVWVEQVGEAVPARFAGETTADGLRVYKYHLSYEGQAAVAAPVNPKETGENYEVVGRKNLLVEPRSGTVVETGVVKETALRSVDAGARDTPAEKVYELSYSMSEDSLATSVRFASDEAAKLRLQFTYIPRGLLLIGAFCLAVGALAGFITLADLEDPEGGSPDIRQGSAALRLSWSPGPPPVLMNG